LLLTCGNFGSGYGIVYNTRPHVPPLANPQDGRQIIVHNNCSFGITTIVGKGEPADQKQWVDGGQFWSTYVPVGWTAGRVWGQRPGFPDYPNTLAEFQMDGWNGLDFYDISLVDGFNLPMAIWANLGQEGDCSYLQCNAPILQQCPNEIRVVQNGQTVACNSACSQWHLDTDCCQNQYNNKDCPMGNYAKWFKAMCPRAYSYPMDYVNDQPACKNAQYWVTFCPV